MTKMIGMVIMLMITINNAGNAQNNFLISPSTVKPGDEIRIFYNPQGTALEGMSPVKGIIALYRNFSWEVLDLDMNMNDSGWAATYKVPEGTALLTCNFRVGDKIDKGPKETYSWMIMQDKDTHQAGAFAGWGLLRSKSMRWLVPDMLEDSSRVSDSLAYYLMEREFREHPASRRKLFYTTLRLIKSAMPQMADSVAKDILAYIRSLPDVTELELTELMFCFRSVNSNFPLSDSLEKVILSKFPNGQAARDKQLHKLLATESVDSRDSLWQIYKAAFPLKDYMLNNNSSEWALLFYEKVYRSIVYNQIIFKNNYDTMLSLLPTASLELLIDFHFHIVENPMVALEKQYRSPQFLLPYSTAIIKQLEKASEMKGWNEAALLSPWQWNQKLIQMTAAAYKTHAFVLQQNGDVINALVYAEKARRAYKYQDATLNGIYTSLLIANGRENEVKKYIEASANENSVTPEMIEWLKNDYVKRTNSDTGFDAWFNSLKSRGKVEVRHAEIRAEMFKRPAPAFRLESNKGGYVSSNSFKGKIVVIDFWATWCAPCKAAMPGMQMAVNKYSDDKNVSFYFIATDERSPEFKKVIADFMKEKKYDFNVLYDTKSKKTGYLDDTFVRFEKYGWGIPQKWVIDQEGNLRWFTNGGRTPSEIADEITYIVELLKAEKKS